MVVVPQPCSSECENRKPLGCSSPHFAQSVISFWIGDNRLNGHDGLVDLRLQLAEFFYVQEPEDLSSFVEDGVWMGTDKGEGGNKAWI